MIPANLERMMLCPGQGRSGPFTRHMTDVVQTHWVRLFQAIFQYLRYSPTPYWKTNCVARGLLEPCIRAQPGPAAREEAQQISAVGVGMGGGRHVSPPHRRACRIGANAYKATGAAIACIGGPDMTTAAELNSGIEIKHLVCETCGRSRPAETVMVTSCEVCTGRLNELSVIVHQAPDREAMNQWGNTVLDVVRNVVAGEMLVNDAQAVIQDPTHVSGHDFIGEGLLPVPGHCRY